MTAKPSFRAEFIAGEGCRNAVYMARWVNTRGETGPWSEITTATVAVQGVEPVSMVGWRCSVSTGPNIQRVVDELATRGLDLPEGRVSLDRFGDSPELSRSLIALIRSGGKRAGASLLWSHEHEGDPVPEVGDIGIVLDDADEPALVTRVTSVVVCPFDQVTPEFAAREGEGDLSLAWWREAHWRFFSRECAAIGRVPDTSMPVVCAAFEVLHVL
jgi:uncharacterized protein YhfF